jgi:hypothetical protein
MGKRKVIRDSTRNVYWKYAYHGVVRGDLVYQEISRDTTSHHDASRCTASYRDKVHISRATTVYYDRKSDTTRYHEEGRISRCITKWVFSTMYHDDR